MKRGRPQRKTELKTKKPMGRGKGLKPGASAKPKRPRRTGPGQDVMAILATRSGGLCEIGVLCLGRAAAVDPSHRVAKGMGGTKDPRSNTASNNLHACRRCHMAVEADPAGAYARGWKVRHGVTDPADIPVWHWVHGWVYLDDEGGHRPAVDSELTP